jgi:hypothetical protein
MTKGWCVRVSVFDDLVVNDELKAMARCMVDWQWEIAQKAARPVNSKKIKRMRA